MKKYLTIITFVLFTISTEAQDMASATLVWKADACLDVSTGISSTASDELVSYSGERIEWRDGVGNVKAIYSIIEVNGQWTNVMNNGTILYEVRSDGQQGTIQFSRVNGIPSVQIVLLKPEGNPDIFRFSVSTITTF